MQAEIDAWHCKREQGWLVDRLSTRAGIRRHKALEELEAEHAKLGYQSEAVVRSRDIYLHTLAVIDRLIKLPPEKVLPEIHALRADLGDYLLYTRSELAEFAEGDQARQNLQAALIWCEGLGARRAETDLKPVIEHALLTWDYMLECVNKPQDVLTVLDEAHGRYGCRACQAIDSSRDIERGRSMDNPYVDWQLESDLSQLVLADRLAIRQTLPVTGIAACLEADTSLRAASLTDEFK